MDRFKAKTEGGATRPPPEQLREIIAAEKQIITAASGHAIPEDPYANCALLSQRSSTPDGRRAKDYAASTAFLTRCTAVNIQVMVFATWVKTNRRAFTRNPSTAKGAVW